MRIYYVQKGTCFGKTYKAKDDAHAIAWAKGYAEAKGWKHFHVIYKGKEA